MTISEQMLQIESQDNCADAFFHIAEAAWQNARLENTSPIIRHNDDLYAAGYFRKAAESGHAMAQYRYGEMHYYGFGLTRDLQTAFCWFTRAAAKGQLDAKCMIGQMYLNREIKSVKSSPIAMAVKYFAEAAKEGCERAEYYLGRMFETEQRDIPLYGDLMAFYWYGRAVTKGYPEARRARDELLRTKMTQEPVLDFRLSPTRKAPSAYRKTIELGDFAITLLLH